MISPRPNPTIVKAARSLVPPGRRVLIDLLACHFGPHVVYGVVMVWVAPRSFVVLAGRGVMEDMEIDCLTMLE